MDADVSDGRRKILFESVIFTTTNLTSKEKAKVTDVVSFMGGKIRNDLTSETNVLIVGNIETPKSKYCLKHRTDVTLLYPDDLFDIYKRFKEKSIPSLTIQVLDDYPWPIFDSCLFCLSRLRDVENECYEKTYITKLIDHFGGKSIASLTPKVTYLITDKREGKRYESALEWNINPIHPKWIIDCCNCQRILNPSLYDISKIKDLNLIGVGAYKKTRNVIDYGDTSNNPLFSKCIQEFNTKNRNNILKYGKENFIDNKLFTGFIFSSFGFNKQQTEKLFQILKENGAEIQDEYDLSITHILVPSTLTMDKIPENILRLKSIADSKIINEWFLERCLHYNNVCNDSWSLPPLNLNLNYEYKIHITGFSDIEHLHITKLIKNLNLTMSTELTEDCDFLVSNLHSLGLNKENSPQLFTYKFNDILTSKTTTTSISISLTKKKINSAKKWNIPVLSLAFIWEFSQTGLLPPVLDIQWCIFAPRSLRPASNFLEYARSVSGGTFQTQINKDDNDENNRSKNQSPISSPTKLPVQLPSPRKNSQKKWPKLVGTASESQLKLTNETNINNDEDYEFKSKRKLILDNNMENKTRNLIDFEDDFGVDDIPVFKKRRI
jgi:DNA replication regulator DPB11